MSPLNGDPLSALAQAAEQQQMGGGERLLLAS